MRVWLETVIMKSKNNKENIKKKSFVRIFIFPVSFWPNSYLKFCKLEKISYKPIHF